MMTRMKPFFFSSEKRLLNIEEQPQYVSTRRLWQDVCRRVWSGCVGGFGLVALELSWLTMEFWIKGPAGTLGKGSCWYWQDTGSEDQQVVERHW